MNLIAFDIDGVVLDIKIGGFKYLAKSIGKEKEMLAIDAEYQRRKHFGPWGLEELAALLQGCEYNTLKNIASKLVKENLMPGFLELVQEIKNHQDQIVLVSSNPLVISEYIKETYGLDYVIGTEQESLNGICTGKILRKVDRYSKKERLQEVIANKHFEKIFIIGDSLTDLPMAELGSFIAFNCLDDNVREQADYIIQEKDLSQIIKVIYETN